jgi:hypothetical protein
MSLKSAAFLALLGAILLTILQVWRLVSTVMAVSRGLLPSVLLVSSFIYAFAAVTAVVFFCVFHRRQS